MSKYEKFENLLLSKEMGRCDLPLNLAIVLAFTFAKVDWITWRFSYCLILGMSCLCRYSKHDLNLAYR
jgi:uncharacterized membrane protein